MTDPVSPEISFDERANAAENPKIILANEASKTLPVIDDEGSAASIADQTSDHSPLEIQTEQHGEKPAPGNREATKGTTIDSRLTLPESNNGKPSSFAKLVRTWETYISDGTSDQFQPMHMFQQLNLCGTEGLARLTAPPLSSITMTQADRRLFEPIVLRHTHSTPLRHTPSILDDDDEDEPPPVGLEILNRSRSTPLWTSANSAFGTTLRTMPFMSGPDDRSAFLPPYRLKPSLSSDRIARHTTFNPIRYDKEMEAEPTSIEVMDMPPQASLKETPVRGKIDPSKSPSKSKTASRAGRFLSDVRNLRRRRRMKGGRENPARPPSSSDESGKKIDCADEETLSSKSSTNSSEKMFGTTSNHSCRLDKNSDANSKSSCPSEATPYLQLDSDQDEDGNHFHRREISMEAESPATVPSPDYHQLEDDRPPSRVGRVRIQVSNDGEVPPYPIASPESAQMDRDASTLTPHSEDSPGTSRCSATTYTSGHTTHATNTTYSSGYMSHLSAISETDREVMEANKAGPLLRQEEEGSSSPKNDSLHKSIPLSSSRQARYEGYIELSNSPMSLRDGANVPAERFFTFTDSPTGKRGLGRLRTSSSLRKGTTHSPTTVSSSSMTTNSSASSSGDEPPTFVSYLDRKTTSDLTSLRESVEASSPRAADDHEKRESSPAELLGYSDVIFEEAQAPRDTTSKKPRPIWPTKGLHFGRRVRSLPPRSPHKGARATNTPPPRGGNVSPALSPPRNIVDHRIDPNVSRPNVLRSTPGSPKVLSGHEVSPEVLSSSGNVNYAHIPGDGMDQDAYEIVRMSSPYDTNRNYYMALPRGSSPTALLSQTSDEHGIEILKTDSKEESSPTFVTPEKGSSK